MLSPVASRHSLLACGKSPAIELKVEPPFNSGQGGSAMATRTDTKSASTVAKSPRTDRGRRTLRAILDAAGAEFGERGFQGASISRITARAGVALGSFYTYFDSKEAVFQALVTDMSGRVADAVRPHVEAAPDASRAKGAGLAAFLDFVRAHKEIYRIIDEAEFVDSDGYRRHYASTVDRITARLRAAAARGEVRPGIGEVEAWAIVGMNVFLGFATASGTKTCPRPRSAPLPTACCARAWLHASVLSGRYEPIPFALSLSKGFLSCRDRKEEGLRQAQPERFEAFDRTYVAKLGSSRYAFLSNAGHASALATSFNPYLPCSAVTSGAPCGGVLSAPGPRRQRMDLRLARPLQIIELDEALAHRAAHRQRAVVPQSIAPLSPMFATNRSRSSRSTATPS
jgi:AcrR family transcriptional regulator